ncbi:MAG TPA: FG-GAP-like repeat-containing protein, partial [Planctomycetota bacterium]|nr:FG-GAP-like repeat-containing protein [Planctomycetota bacterium]
VGVANHVDVGDVDGDVDAFGFGAVALNDGLGRFTRRDEPALAFFRLRSLAADVNGDGRDDLVSIDGAVARVHLASAGGGFVPAPTPPAFLSPTTALPTAPWSLAAGDVDGDGDVDLAFGVLATAYTSAREAPVFWINDGLGGFAAPPGPPILAPAPAEHVFLRDFDGDGDLDALFGGGISPTFELYVNVGGGFMWAAAATTVGVANHVDVGDVDGDGTADIVHTASHSAASGVVVLPLGPSGFGAFVHTFGLNFLPPFGGIPGQPLTPATLTCVDVDGDGTDEVVLSGPQGARVHDASAAGVTAAPTLSAGWLNAAPSPGAAGSLRCRDLDGDGDRDFLAIAYGDVAVVRNVGGGFAVEDGRVRGDMPPAFSVADVDSDGALDVVGLHAGIMAPAGLLVGLGDGDGRLTTGPRSLLLNNQIQAASFTAPFDRDGDGDVDLFGTTFLFGGAVLDRVYDGDGSGGFVALAPTPSIASAAALAVCDVDLDGDDDVFVGRRALAGGNGPGTLFVANLSGALAAPALAGGGSWETQDLLVGDFDADGYPDVLEVNGLFHPFNVVPQHSVIHFGGAAGPTPVVQTGVAGVAAAVGDFDGDGDSDAVIANRVYFAVGGVLTPGPFLPTPLLNRATAGDLDGDGDADLVETPCTVFMNLGGGVFGPPESATPRLSVAPYVDVPSRSTVADLDRDGDLDVVAPGPRVFLNATRQTANRASVFAGAAASLDVYGPPGGAWWLFASPSVAALPLPPFGTVLLDPAAATSVAAGVHPAGGLGAAVSTVSLVVPPGPGLTGLALHWQGVDVASARFTNRTTSTVLGL